VVTGLKVLMHKEEFTHNGAISIIGSGCERIQPSQPQYLDEQKSRVENPAG
jgi:hypothetical protein